MWEPLNLTETCPSNAQFAACSYFGYIYLNILVQLYSDSADRRIQSRLKQATNQEDQTYYVSIEETFEHVRTNNSHHKFDRGRGKSKEGERDEEYDFIVVGAGTAGCVVANRLTEHDFNVLLLEAGPEQPDVTLVPALAPVLAGSNIMWMFRTQPDGKSCLALPEQRCAWPTGRTMGGSSSVNTLAYVRGNRLDYDTWAAMGNHGWSYRDVLPFFKKSEKNLNIENQNQKYHGVDGEQTISRYPYIDIPSIMMTDAYYERGLPLNDFNGEKQEGTMQAQAFAQFGERVSANNAFIQPIRYKRKNLKVKVESLAVEILIDDKKKAYGVKYLTTDGKLHKATATKEVIVSAGPINSPKLLMLSGVGPKKHLNEVGIKVVKDLAVGYNLHDHVTFDGLLIVLPNDTATIVNNEQLLKDVIDFKEMLIKEGPLSSNGAVHSVSFFKTDPNLPAPDIQFQADEVQSWREYVKGPVEYKSVPIFPSVYYDGVLPRAMNVVPKSRGRLFLNSSDVYAHPLIYANYFGEIEDLTTLIKGVKFLLTLEKTKAFKERGAHFYKQSLQPCEGFKWGTEEYIACMAVSYTLTTYHPVGTCKMGPRWDRSAVVDPRLRVYGIEGLRVIDSSIMPIVPRGNTNAPSMMVGERGVALVLEDWLP